MKKIAILGSSGSIGSQTLDVIRGFRDRYEVVALCVRGDVETLKKQADEFSPKIVGVCDENAFIRAKSMGFKAKLIGGESALTEIAAIKDVDILVVAVVGMCGLKAVVAALENGTAVALANKEALVAGGDLVMSLSEKVCKPIIPIDSEHSAIMQCLFAGKPCEVKRIILTASGGPFFGKDKEFLRSVTPALAVKHPTWKMGRKISVDSATMMNKALEIIEAHYLFGVKNIDYVIHPQSVIHSLVEFIDGSVMGQLAAPDMKLPISYALGYPDRLVGGKNFAFDKTLTFFEPDEKTFPLPRIAKEVLKTGGNAPCIFNAAGEACVELFLNNKIAFTDISIIVEKTLSAFPVIGRPTLEDIYSTFNEVKGKLTTDYKVSE